MDDGVERAIQEVVDEAAAELADVERVALADGTAELRRGGRAFLVSAPDRVEFRLTGDVAIAARRTPGVLSSPRGERWIIFEPVTLDRFALDRAVSWTGFAWRVAPDD